MHLRLILLPNGIHDLALFTELGVVGSKLQVEGPLWHLPPKNTLFLIKRYQSVIPHYLPDAC